MTSLYEDILTDIEGVWLSLKFELRKHVRRKRVLMTGLLAVLLPVLFYVVPAAAGREFASTADAFASSSLGFVSLLIILSGAIFAGDSVSSEHEKKTGLMLYSTPQRRTTVLIGKYSAGLLATWAMISVYYLMTAGEISLVYGAGEISANFVKSFLVALLYAASVVGIIYFLSSAMKKSIVATLLGFFLLMMILPIVSTVLTMVEVDPWFLVTHSAGLMTDVLGVSSAGGFGGANQLASGISFSPDFYIGILVMAAYAIVSFLLGTAIAHRRDME